MMLPKPSDPDEPVTAVCVSAYYADLVPAHAYVFHIDSTRSGFVVYASEPHRYLINHTYTLTISEPGHVPLRLPAAEWAFLRNCLYSIEQRWHDAIARADAGAKQPPADRPPAPDRLDLTPTPAGYQTIGQVFRTEAQHVRHLRNQLDHLLQAAGISEDGDRL